MAGRRRRGKTPASGKAAAAALIHKALANRRTVRSTGHPAKGSGLSPAPPTDDYKELARNTKIWGFGVYKEDGSRIEKAAAHLYKSFLEPGSEGREVVDKLFKDCGIPIFQRIEYIKRKLVTFVAGDQRMMSLIDHCGQFLRLLAGKDGSMEEHYEGYPVLVSRDIEHPHALLDE